MSITGKGTGWEFKNSIWIAWTFIFMLNWIAFLWIGVRAKSLKWKISGCLYIVFCFVFPLLGVSDGLKDTVFGNFFMYVFLIAWIASIIHAFLSRREYLIRRETVINNIAAANAVYYRHIQNKYAQSYGYPGQNTAPAPVPQPDFPQRNFPEQPPLEAASVQKINLNTASEQELASLPGVSVALAKKAVEKREQGGGYNSVREFCDFLELMPHFTVQIENAAIAEPVIPEKPSQNNSRVVDI